ncbi:glycosyl transferase [Thermaurantimonas aggregans]|uniref:Glycosyl transferase n=1 Tax=Thermaurantimonas aggregans TaxID=2173829 RepID=A0A401XMR1_9FLAO|nr:glycosyltransferase [Thermaurantimonas aggregans]MCX8149410.1 glycogen/starch synthase [Thermaurantimonas aggregans]GCD78294.1 glycosyl transferase [Thermaurantimonas aggregans]
MSTLAKNSYLFEASWEVGNQLGGIYTVIRSKLPSITKIFGDRYCLLGPLVNDSINAEFEEIDDTSDFFGKVVKGCRDLGFEVKYGIWLVTGRPRILLINPVAVYNRLDVYKKNLHQNYGLEWRENDELYDQVLMWSDTLRSLFRIVNQLKGKNSVIAHFHEWMASVPILDIRKENLDIKTVFTTHATMLGRYLAMNDPEFYQKLPYYNPEEHARRFGITSMFQIEKLCAQHAHAFTTVSELTANECQYLLSKKPDVITPNGLNLARFSANHEIQVRHENYKKKIQTFVMAHFFPSYTFDLSKTLFFFTSGRYEYKNKGFDVTIEALKVLNRMMIEANVDLTIVTFFITKTQAWNILPDVLEQKAKLDEIRNTCSAIEQQIAEKLFFKAASSHDHNLPDLNELVDEYWRLRYRRTILNWKSNKWPVIVTHNLVNDVDDHILNGLRHSQLFNSPFDKVKVVYHPDFIVSTNPLFSMDYGQFVRGCHLGIFPSYYEPWGYTPLECIARGVPAVTSDLSGFGRYVMNMEEDFYNSGVYAIKRLGKNNQQIVSDLSKFLFQFVKMSQRQRMIMRNKLEDFSEHFDWSNLVKFYIEAYEFAIQSQ